MGVNVIIKRSNDGHPYTDSIESHPAGNWYQVSTDGHLHVSGPGEHLVAVYAPGQWSSAAMTT